MYFPVRLIKTVDLNPAKNYLLRYYLHGVISVGAFASFATEGTGFAITIAPYITRSI